MADDSAASEELASRMDASGSDATSVDDVKTYEKVPGFATTEGQDYEVKMCALLYARALNSKGAFQLASNVAGAGALDDIVFKFTTSDQVCHTAFIQLKHKKTAKVYVEQLIKQKGDFSLTKYFEAFMDIKNVFKKKGKDLFSGLFVSCHFVIITNAPLQDVKEGVETRDLPSPVDEYIKLNEVKTNFTEDMVESLYIDLKKEEEKQKKPTKHPMKSNEDDAKDFLRRFKMFTGQPSEDQLDDVIKEELKRYCKIHGEEYIDLMYTNYIDKMKMWCHSNVGIILEKNSSILSEVLQQAKAEQQLLGNKTLVEALIHEQMQKFQLKNFKFLENSTASLKSACADPHSHVNVEAQESVRITTNKVLQFLEARNEPVIVMGTECLLKQRHSVMTSWRSGNKTLLVVVSEETAYQKLDGICREITQVLHENKDKRIVLVSPHGDSFARRLEEKMGANFTLIQDSFNLEQLHQESIDFILEKKVTFQGHSTTFGMILGSDLQMISTELKDVLETIIASESLVIGANLQEDIEYYVPRTMQCKNIVSTEIFKDGNFAGRIIIHGATWADVHHLVQTREQGIKKKFQQSGEGLVFNAYCVEKKERDGIPEEPNKAIIDDNKERDVNTRDHVHYFQLDEGKLFWKETQGDIEFIRKYIDTNESNTVQEPESRVVLVSAEPGMGKTTLLTHEAQRIKQSHPDSWVVSIALSQNTSLFARAKSQDLNAEQFLESALGLDKLYQSLFRFALRHSGKMAVFLDGFDEVAPTYTEECLTLINGILAAKVSNMWISSRYSTINILETHLSTLALTLKKFTLEDQKLFLVKYWGILPDVVKEELDEFIDRILDVIAKSINDNERDFTGIPLQTRMLSEIYQDSITNIAAIKIPGSLNTFQLVEIFVHKKFDTYLKKPNTFNESNTGFHEHWKEYKEFKHKHMTAALFILFGESDLQSLNISKFDEFMANIEKGVDKTGIIDRVVDGKPVFLHRVFAEYFAARWFSKHYLSNKVFMKKHLLSETFGVVRHMFDRILARDNDLHIAVLSADAARVEDLLKGGCDVNSTDKGGRTALHLSVMAGLHNPSTDKPNIPMIQLLMRHNARVDLEDNVLKWTPVQYAEASELWAEINAILEHARVDISKFITIKKRIGSAKFWENIVKQDCVNVLSLLTQIYNSGTALKKRISKRSQDNIERFMNPMSLLLMSAECGSTGVVRHLLDITSGETSGTTNQQDGATSSSSKTQWFNRRALKKLENPRDRAEYVNTRDDEGRSALWWASKEGHHDIVQLLIESAADVTTRDHGGDSALMQASWRGHVLVVRALLNTFSNESDRAEYVNTRDDEGHSALWWASYGGRHDIVQLLIESAADVTTRDHDGASALMQASRRGHVLVVRALLNTFSNESDRAEYVNTRDDGGRSALWWASSRGHHDIVQLLIESAADVTTRDHDGASALMQASIIGHVLVVRALLNSFSNESDRAEYVNTRNDRGHSALWWASCWGHHDIVQLLIESAADVTTRRHGGASALMEASSRGHVLVVRALLDTFSNESDRAEYVNTRDDEGRSALWWASSWGHHDIVQLLIESAADVTTRDPDGDSALMQASIIGHVLVVRALLNSFSNESDRAEYVNTRNDRGHSALWWASSDGHHDIVQLLIESAADVTGIYKGYVAPR